ncbi:tetratricopeptide repeat protein [Psychrobacter sp. M9-54-1]|uniref:tetratricopeptide repeat protein n=1 Tax=Psychrobacter sp. M9-54-1 TaxID=2782386 RepID=UPI001909E6F9|nr:tetratricopeptide repeat protein [Psychrobacter sp. M9-54-1]MBK3393898.1 tetratricopeptide repeat protein [Psychrobacter sp. M9-54-1]
MARSVKSVFKQSAYQSDGMDSKKVFALRKEGKLQEAYNLATSLLNSDKDDEWNKRAMAWVLVDIIKIEINKNLQNAIAFFNQLISLKIQDEVLETQIKYLQPRLAPVNSEIEKASALSKNGNYLSALNQFRQIFKNNTNLFQAHHDAYGWAIYRYLKNESESISSIEVKRILFEYNNLQSERPSMLHSQILAFVMYYSRSHQGIDIYRYFLSWNPAYLSQEDVRPSEYQGKVTAALLERLGKELVNSPSVIDFNDLDRRIKIPHNISLIDSYRESVFWLAINANKENRLHDLWNILDGYVSNYSGYGSGKWHSDILGLAERTMVETQAWRFPSFLQRWGVQNFQREDWVRGVYNDKPTKSLVEKVLSKLVESIKDNKNPNEIRWMQPLFEKASIHYDKDIWALRNYAMFLIKMGETDKAIQLYKDILLSLNDQAYAWHELAKLLQASEPKLAISMLCMAVSKQPKEDFLGDIRLNLAMLFINQQSLGEAKRELETYESHRKVKEWKVSQEFNKLMPGLSEVTALDYDRNYYRKNTELAESYIYKDIAWQDFLVFQAWTSTKNDKSDEMIAVSNLQDIEIVIKSRRFKALRNTKINDVIKCKVYYDKAKERHTAVLVEKSDTTYKDIIGNAMEAIAVIDGVNQNRELFHYHHSEAINGNILFANSNIEPKVGKCIAIKYFMHYNTKFKKKMAKVLDATDTNKTNNAIVKSVYGEVRLKYKKDGRTLSYDQAQGTDVDITNPNFAFLEDYHIPSRVIKEAGITHDQDVKILVLLKEGKWNTIEIEKV